MIINTLLFRLSFVRTMFHTCLAPSLIVSSFQAPQLPVDHLIPSQNHLPHHHSILNLSRVTPTPHKKRTSTQLHTHQPTTMFARRALSHLPTPTTARTFSTTPRASLARMQLIGRLAAQPELTPTSTGRDIVRYAIGTTHRTSRGEETSWFRVASFVDEGARRDLVLGLPKGYVVVFIT